MKTENIVKCSLEPAEEKMIINAIKKVRTISMV